VNIISYVIGDGLQDITVILSEKDDKIKSLEEKLKELKVIIYLFNLVDLLRIVIAGKECVGRIQCFFVTRTPQPTNTLE